MAVFSRALIRIAVKGSQLFFQITDKNHRKKLEAVFTEH